MLTALAVVVLMALGVIAAVAYSIRIYHVPASDNVAPTSAVDMAQFEQEFNDADH